MTRRFLSAFIVFGSISSCAFAQGDPRVVEQIIDEGKNRSQVMNFLDYLSMNIGPRLTGSSRLLQANAWTRDQFAAMGMANAHLFKWGEVPVAFDRGPSKVKMTKPVEKEFAFTTRSWSAGTEGPVSGPVVKQPKDMTEFEAVKDTLKGKWVLAKPRPRGRFSGMGRPGGPSAASQPAESQPARDGAPSANDRPNRRGIGARADRPASEERAQRDGADRDGGARGEPAPPGDAGPTSRPGRGRGDQPDPDEPLVKAMYAAGILGRIVSSSNDLVITGGARNWREMDFKKLPTEVSITISRADYDAINSALSDGEDVTIEADLQNHFVEGPFPLYNVVAEIPGTEFPEQVIIVSGHLDSWDGPGSQGSQDNGVGTSTTLETARILNKIGVKPRRTIRFILWTGEEQGLLGSKAYVKALTDEEKANISAVFVDDGGTNYDGGLQCVRDMEPMLATAVEPINKAFPDMPVKINVRERMPRGGGSDHSSFNAEGIPGFFWDETGSGGKEGKNYTFVHHTQHDTTRYVVPEYLTQSATCAAVTVYNLAMADTMLPRYVPPKEPEETPDTTPFTVAQGPVTGVWEGTIERAQSSANAAGGGGGGRGFGGFTVTIEMATDNRLRGSNESRAGTTKMSGGTFDPATNAVQWRIRNEFMGTVTYNGKLEGETVKGTLKSADGEFNMNFNMERISKDVPPPPPPDEKPTATDAPAATPPAADQPAEPANSRAGNGS